jgi:hypothetical protein
MRRNRWTDLETPVEQDWRSGGACRRDEEEADKKPVESPRSGLPVMDELRRRSLSEPAQKCTEVLSSHGA